MRFLNRFVLSLVGAGWLSFGILTASAQDDGFVLMLRQVADESDNSSVQETDSLLAVDAAAETELSEVPSALPPASPEDFETQLRVLQQKLQVLEQSHQQLLDAEEKRKTADKSKASSGEKGKADSTDSKSAPIWTDMSTDKWTVKLGGHVQADYINWANADPAISGTQDYFEFRRLRLVADGTGYGVCDFRLQMTLEPETVGESPPGTATSPDVKDAYFTMNEIPWLGRVRIGNFFVPFSLEQVTNDTNNIFMERSIPTQGVFAADREVGIAAYNQSDNQRFTWASGIFFDSISDTIKERIDDNQGYRVSGRMTWLPFYDEPSNGRYLIHTGVGVLHTDDQDNRVRARSRPQIREGPRVIDSGVLAADRYTTGNLELAAVMGRVTIQSEAFLSSISLTGAEAVTIHGAYAHLSWFITGENRIYERFGQHGAQFGRNVPYSNFFVVPGSISPGAWEAKTRWSHLNLDSVNAGQYNDITTGFNWYWSDRTRIMFDWIHPVTSSDTTFGETQSDLLAMRFDFNW